MVYFGYDPVQDSPPIQFTPAIVAGATFEQEFTDISASTQPGAKYAPFNFLLIQNASAQTITVQLDTTRTWRLIAGLNLILEPQDIPAFSRISITNNGAGNIAANEVIVKIQKLGIDTRSAVQRTQQTVLGKLLGWR